MDTVDEYESDLDLTAELVSTKWHSTHRGTPYIKKFLKIVLDCGFLKSCTPCQIHFIISKLDKRIICVQPGEPQKNQ